MIIFRTLTRKLREHYKAIIVAMICGVLVVLPTIISIHKTENFKGIYPLLSDDEDYYYTEAREVYDGHLTSGNAYIKEYKTLPYTHPFLGAMFYGESAKLLHLSIPAAGAINDFFLPIFSILLLYSLVYYLTQSKNISSVSSSLFFIFFLPSFNRPVNPQLSFIFLILALYLVFLIVWRRYPIRKVIFYNFLLSVTFGVLVYIYPFYWMSVAVVYVLLTLFRSLVEKDFKYCFQNWISFFIPALIWSMPFALNAMKLAQSPFFAETNLRNGFINTHIPGAFTNIAISILCLPVVYIMQKINSMESASQESTWQSKKTIFLGYCLIFAVIILNWQNIITGKTLQFASHFYEVTVLFSFIIGSLAFVYFKKKEFSKYAIILACFLIILFTTLFYKQKSEFKSGIVAIYSAHEISSLQNISPVLDWFNKNTPSDSVIYALGSDYSLAIPIYTHDNLYFATNAELSLMSDEELENRWIIQNFFEPINDVYIKNNEREIWTNEFIDSYQNKESRRKILQFITRKTYQETILVDQSRVDNVLGKYEKFKNIGFEKAIKTYDVDYIVLDSRYGQYENIIKIFASHKFLSLVIEINGTRIYKVN